jgi:DNA-binding transcriptional regulator YiaG
MSFNNLLKAEMIRQAKRATKSDMSDVVKKLNAQRKEIIALKRQLSDLVKAVKKLGHSAPKAVKRVEAIESDQKLRFRAEGFASLRRKLGVTQAQMAQLLGVSTLTVLKWEKGSTRPRASQLATIAAVRKMGKREALQKLA